MKKSAVVSIWLAILILLSSCGTQGGEADGLTAVISIECTTILENLDDLNPDKLELVPEDGIILAPLSVSFEEGNSVLDLLQYVTREEGIHMEASYTPGTGAAYIEGIANLYEFDCGSLSGWTYMVNGQIPNTAASDYYPQEGDEIIWVYTCDLGRDVGA